MKRKKIMKRKIEFRGKCVSDSKYAGEWVTGGYVAPDVDCKNQNEGLIVKYLGNDTKIIYHVEADTVGQFTGLRDKNGVKIFEGDIIYSEFSDGSNCHCLVGWNDKEVCFGLMDEYAFRSKQEGYDFPKFDSLVLLNFRNHGMKFEVVGNIHDNFDLMK